MGFNFVGCFTQMFSGDFVTGGCGGTFFSLSLFTIQLTSVLCFDMVLAARVFDGVL